MGRHAMRALVLASLLVPTVVAASGCGEGKISVDVEGPSPFDPGCPEGSLGCRCTASNACHTTTTPLVCDRGYCVPEAGTCAPGSEGCACFANGTCDAKDGVPMTCAGNVCSETATPDPGTVGGPCGEAGCSAPLVCVSGRCDDPSCPLGTLGCACGAFGQCADFGGEHVGCEAGKCSRGQCAPGSPGCACGTADACELGFVCRDSICASTGELRVVLASASAEACDVLLGEDGVGDPVVVSAAFAGAVRGHAEIRSPQTALSFFSRDPGPLAPARTAVAVLTRRIGALRPLIVTRAVCFDGRGQALPADAYTLTLE